MRLRLLAAGVVAVALAVAGCGSSGGGSTGGGSTAAGGAATTSGAEGGTLRWAINANVSWDPVTSAAGNEVRHLLLVYEPLIHIDQKGDATPGLATEWTFSKDGRTLDLTLRDGVTFTDGTKLDATVVKDNLERAKNQEGSVLVQLLESITSIDVVDPQHVRLDLSRPDYGLPLVLGGKAGMIVSPKGLQNPKALPTQPVGAGPFKLTKFVPDGESDLVRNPDYWDAKSIHLDGVQLNYQVDPQAILAGLQSGTIDLYSALSGSQVAAAERAGLKVEQFPSLSAATIEVNDAMKPFDDKRVTEAINHAIDREALIKAQNGGIGEVAYQPFPKGYVGYSEEVANLYPHDPEKAKQLLAEAGHADGLDITITYFDVGSFKAQAEQLQAQLEAVGIHGKLTTLPLNQAAERVYVKHDVAFNPNGIVGRESPLQMLQVQYGADGLLNPGRKASPELTKALTEAGKYPLDSPEYPKALQAATALAAKQSAVVMLYTQPNVLIHTDKVSGLQPFIVATRLDGVRLEH